MSDDVRGERTPVERAITYADRKCVGQLGDIADVEERNTEWPVEFKRTRSRIFIPHCVRITKSVRK